MKDIFDRFSVPQIIVGAYVLLIIIGASFLTLPIASAANAWTHPIDALFTAASAVCVTGQITLNTATHWSAFGKTVIILLIQIGGLGFITVWMLFFMMSGLKTNIRQQSVVLEALNLSPGYQVKNMVQYIVKFTLIAQLIGAILLAFSFVPSLGFQRGILYSIFHSISAFNNAGFDLFGDSLISFQNNPYVLFVIAGLIIAGGLGFLVWRDLLTYRRNKRLLRYTKLTLVGTGLIILISFSLFSISEWKAGTFSNLSFGDFLSNVFFMSVTPRTAGYANVDYAQVSQAGLLLTFILMFIGGSSGSIAGGVKVSTILIILIFVYRYFRGQPVILYSRSVDTQTIRRAFFIVFSAIMFITIATFILLVTEEIPPGFGIEYVLMEVISCIGTVGLSMGLTPNLTVIGKIILILLMLIGRVGLMTFLWSIGNHRKQSKLNYPAMTLMIG